MIDDSQAVRRFRRITCVTALTLNLALLSVSLFDVFPRGRPGLHNLVAMLIGSLVSPIMNAALIAVSFGLESALYSNRPHWARMTLVPIGGAVLNLVVVLMIVPSHAPSYPGP